MANENVAFEDELTLKDLILKIQSFGKEIFKKWWIVFSFCSVFIAYFAYGYSKQEITYSASLKFVAEGQTGNSGNGLSSLLGTFGIKKGEKLSPYKIIEVTKSSRILADLLKSKISGDNNVANKLIELYALEEEWTTEDVSFHNYSYDPTVEDSRDHLMLKNLSLFLWGGEDSDGKIDFIYNENNGVYRIIPTFKDEVLSIEVSEIIYELIKHFFENEIFENQRQSATILKEKSDSLKTLLNSKIMQRANFLDGSRNVVRESAKAKALILSQEIQALSFTYSEVIKNYEMTDVNLKDIQPLFIKLDSPFSPIMPNIPSLFKSILQGSLIGMFLSVLMIVLLKAYRDIMK